MKSSQKSSGNADIDIGTSIEVIQTYEYVYNLMHKDYKNSKKKDAAWEVIAETVNASVEECQKLWKSLRDRFVKEKNKIHSGMEAPESSWPHFNSMLFYGNFSRKRKTYTATKAVEKKIRHSEEESEPSSIGSYSPIEIIYEDEQGTSQDMDSARNYETPSTSKGLFTPKGSTKASKRHDAEISNLIMAAEKIVSGIAADRCEKTSVNKTFSQYVCARLDAMNAEDAAEARKQICAYLE
ncbi:unnamed protein product [Diabrotica balteata]|uniref:MADF domain-containing protein n=1 Tax=Diabrotica balteata TaxID=107213 RepID=A0A9N9XGL2_DIABA|nr:unnamed protein product [Diabrotica balteata]